MSVAEINLYEELLEAVKSNEPENVRSILDSNLFSQSLFNDDVECLLHVACSCIQDESHRSEDLRCLEKKRDTIYMLIDAGLDIESKDKNGRTCLYCAVKNEDIFITNILLLCGADMWIIVESNISIYEFVEEMGSVDLNAVFQQYFPGLWRAVENEDIYEARKLVNLWCRTDIRKDNLTLKDVALETGNEEIISLVLGIFDSMKLVYHIYAKNVPAINRLLETKRSRIRLDLRKMSDRGAPILYYLISSADVIIIELFIKHGCQLYTIMQDDFGFDMPVFYSSLTSETSVDVMKALLSSEKPNQEDILYKILYKGQSVLEVALKENVRLDVFSVLIDKGGPQLLCERNQINQTVRDLAIADGKKEYADIIDSIVLSWIIYPYKYPGRRQKLALFGWNLEEVKEELKENLYIDDYFTCYIPLQKQMIELTESIECLDVPWFQELSNTLKKDDNFLWYGRIVGDGMPLLHKAVLYGCVDIVDIILKEKPPTESIDNLFDQNRRTALHYAYAKSSSKPIKSLLMSYGCSEHVLDKVNKEPLDFWEIQDTPEIEELLQRLKSKVFTLPEFDPWKLKNAITDKEALLSLEFDEEASQGSEYESDQSDILEDARQQTRSCLIM